MAKAKAQQGTLGLSTTVSSGSVPFDTLRDALAADPGLRAELESALRLNVHRVNPTERANRFGSGAAVEWILASVAYAAGVLSIPGGHNANGFDLRDLRASARGMWSVKNQTAASGTAYRITNGLGGAGKGFVEPTMFLSPALPGIVFIDPAIHTAVAAEAYKTGDATMLGFPVIRTHAITHPECVAPCEMPVNPKTGDEDPWRAFIESILAPAQYPRLSRMFEAAKPTTGTFASQLQAITALYDAGTLTRQQFDAAVAALTRQA